MTPLAHVSAGYLVYKAIQVNLGFIFKIPLALVLAVLGALAPDIDGFFGNNMNDHRYTVFHAPFFWLLVLVVGVVGGRVAGNSEIGLGTGVFTLGVFSHLLLDYVSARTCGIRIYYPFSKMILSLFPLQPEKGNVTTILGREQLDFWRFYLDNKFLIAFEIVVVFLGFGVYIL